MSKRHNAALPTGNRMIELHQDRRKLRRYALAGGGSSFGPPQLHGRTFRPHWQLQREKMRWRGRDYGEAAVNDGGKMARQVPSPSRRGRRVMMGFTNAGSTIA